MSIVVYLQEVGRAALVIDVWVRGPVGWAPVSISVEQRDPLHDGIHMSTLSSFTKQRKTFHAC